MKPIGYSYLNQHYKLLLPKLGVEVYQASRKSEEGLIDYGASKRKVISSTIKIADHPYDNMVAAIKYQGIRLHFFAAIFKVVDSNELATFIKTKPTSIYNRVIWHLYEWLNEEELPIKSLKTSNYVKLFDDRYYYTLQDGTKDKRTRVVNNAIGTNAFCATIRKTPAVRNLENVDVYDTAYAQMQRIGDDLSVDAIGRSVNYLYTKETKSSTEIEKESPDKRKMQRFLNTIKNAGLFELTKEKIINIQNQIVEESKKTDDYRSEEIYVGTTIQRLGGIDEDIHFIGPLAKHVHSMMEGLLQTHHQLMMDRTVPSLMHATIISFGEVYIHPLNDGNGRTHRYLIHDVLKQREPQHQFIIPISAAILKNYGEYDKVLESISRPIMAMLDYELDSENDNKVVIHNDIDYMYRFPDYTAHVEFVYKMMEVAIAKELHEEICVILAFDLIKNEISSCEDIPNNSLDKIVSIIINGGGKVSKRKMDFVAKHIHKDNMATIESFAQGVLDAIWAKLEVNVSEVLGDKRISS